MPRFAPSLPAFALFCYCLSSPLFPLFFASSPKMIDEYPQPCSWLWGFFFTHFVSFVFFPLCFSCVCRLYALREHKEAFTLCPDWFLTSPSTIEDNRLQGCLLKSQWVTHQWKEKNLQVAQVLNFVCALMSRPGAWEAGERKINWAV